MIRALENNTIGVGLAAAGGLFLLAILGLVVIWAMPPSTGQGEDESADDASSVSITALREAEPLEQYAVVSERPVFNEDRRPAPVFDPDELTEDLPEEDVGAPDVTLAGVIITPTTRMVTLKSPDHPQSLVAFEGQPLEGNFGTWQVTLIEERRVTLASADGEEMQLELQVHDAVISEPPETAPRGSANDDQPGEEQQVAQNSAESNERMTRAEEIRQRIEERREELRRAAENAQQDEAQNYKDAIQNIINEGPNRRPARDQDDSSDDSDQ